MAEAGPPERHEPYLYELAWILPSIAIPTAMLVAVVIAAFGMGIHLPGIAGTVDPAQLRETPPFDNPGLSQIAPNHYQLTIVASAWQFQPNEVRIPAGAQVDIVATSRDVIHGFEIPGTNVNLMVIPGRIARTTVTFHQPGTYQFMCHEYCGVGHHLMWGRIIVEGTP
ncbi:cytochrome c oxidase subunit II [Thermomicrobiaceae bacterium CFH 74404]|uniref:Cytochrome c oxidase subunit II n=1 Tax=Thermalbibacter longus TaxID=2951981 RepID=A0AA42B9D4_9BACT|nr:cytochrome c oxidase subunit II [Thermalbibacter longus]MCM8748381.1 cytochrome c oxidase subunit II [Thermalbibacter longus]